MVVCRISPRYRFCIVVACIALLASVLASPVLAAGRPDAKATSLPAPIAAMIKNGKGVKFQDKFDAPGGLTGFVLSAATGERRIYYVTPDRKYAMLGIMLDQELNNITADHQKTYMNVLEFLGAAKSDPASESASPIDLARINALQYTEGTGPIELNVVFDSQCGKCRSLYAATRKRLDRFTIRWVPSATIDEKSRRWMEAFVTSKDRAATLDSLFGVEDPPVPHAKAGEETAAAIARSAAIMKAAGTTRYPLVLYVDASNAEVMSMGGLSARELDLIAVAASRAPAPVPVTGK